MGQEVFNELKAKGEIIENALSGDEDARRLGDDLPQDPRNVPVSTEKGSKSLFSVLSL